MLRYSVFGLLAVAACSSAPTPAPQFSSEPPVVPAVAPAAAAQPVAIPVAAKPKKICKTMRSTGSNVPKRVCSTQEEWDEFNRRALTEAEETRRGMGNMSNRPEDERQPPPSATIR